MSNVRCSSSAVKYHCRLYGAPDVEQLLPVLGDVHVADRVRPDRDRARPVVELPGEVVRDVLDAPASCRRVRASASTATRGSENSFFGKKTFAAMIAAGDQDDEDDRRRRCGTRAARGRLLLGRGGRWTPRRTRAGAGRAPGAVARRSGRGDHRGPRRGSASASIASAACPSDSGRSWRDPEVEHTELLELDRELRHDQLDRRRREPGEHLPHLLGVELLLARCRSRPGVRRRPAGSPGAPGWSGRSGSTGCSPYGVQRLLMCLVWCHGNPIGKWDRTHLRGPHPAGRPDCGAVRVRVVLRFGRRPTWFRVGGRAVELPGVNQPPGLPDGSRIGEVMPTSLL